jgi:TRAP-type uncharacterized transport system substrate-binding protein
MAIVDFLAVSIFLHMKKDMNEETIIKIIETTYKLVTAPLLNHFP